MLTPDDLKYLRTGIFRFIAMPVQVNLVSEYVPPHAVAEIPLFTLLKAVVDWILTQAMKASTPKYFLKVVKDVEALTGALPAGIAAVVQRVEADPTTWVPWTSQGSVNRTLDEDPDEVHGGDPFLDRANFRSLLPRAADHEGPLTTVVLGDGGSGKSYLHAFCQRLRDHWGEELRVACADVDRPSVRGLQPDTPALMLANGLGTDMARCPRPHEDPHRFASNLATWILTATPEGSLPALALLDGFNHPQLPDALHTFVYDLVRGLESDPAAQKRLRIVLLGYDTGRLEREELPFEQCVLEYVDRGHLDAWFKGRYPGHPDYMYDDAVDSIIQRIPADGPSRMLTLCTMARAACAAFERA